MDSHSPPVLDIPAVLKQVRFLADWPAAQIEQLAAASHVRRFASGETILQTGVPTEHLVAIASGSLLSQRQLKNGKTALVGYLLAGQVTGHLAVLDGKPASLDAVANSDVEVIMIPGKAFMDIVSNDPVRLMSIIHSLCRRTRLDYEAIILRTGNSTRCQIAKIIAYLARGTDNKGQPAQDLDTGMTQEQIAAQIGCTRQTVNRVISQMVKEGVLARPYGQIRIRDLPKLNAIIAKEGPAPREIVSLLEKKEDILKGGD